MRILVTILIFFSAGLFTFTQFKKTETPVLNNQASPIESKDISFETTTTKNPNSVQEQKTPELPVLNKDIEPVDQNPPEIKLTESNPLETVATIKTQTGNELVRKAIVNIQCRATNHTLSSVSGSGVIIDPRGVIVTNAHIAQYFLLTDYPQSNSVQCVIRTGSPAYPRYRAELLYISPSWIANNTKNITDLNPTGTGEYDYAFLRITEALDQSTLPLFDFLVLEETEPAFEESVLIAGYPASFLGSIAIERDLYLVSSQSTISDMFTFKTNTPDLLSLGNTILAQKGASGGAVATQQGRLRAIIVTTTEADSTSERDLRAITVSHIEQSLQSEINASIETLLLGDLTETAKKFHESVVPTLKATLVETLNSN